MKRSDDPRAMFCAELAYLDEQGKSHRVLANSSSSSIRGLVLGRKMKALADRDSADDIMLMNDWWLVTIVGLVFLIVGMPFITSAVSHLTMNPATLVVAAVISGTLGFKIYKKIHPLLDTRNSGGWKEKLKTFRREKLRAKEEAFQSLDPEEIDEYAATQNQQMKRALPVLLLVGIGLCIGGGLWERSRLAFIASATTTEGRVIRNEISTSDAHSTYHAVVEFTDANHRVVMYRDDIGASPPSFSVGEKIRIFYQPTNSQRAMIDRGFWNWLVPALMSGVGLLITTLSLRGLLNNRTRQFTSGAAQQART